ncbi:hypothetical protein NL108_018292 [Boleophthalmus pectinirostris]|nr:hypothetical protein NL108_018292 [Boleophthalmus pectinirostris]
MDCLKVHRDISRLTWVKSLQSSVSGRQVRFLRRLLHENLGKSGRYFLYRRDEERLGEKTRRLRRYRTLEEPVEMSSPCDPPTALSTTGRFYQSSGGKTSRSLSAPNTRKYLRRLHTRTAGGALRRGRSRLTDAGLRLCSQVTHDSGLSVKPDDHKNLSTSRV